MKNHTRVFLDALNFDESDFIPCECCGVSAVDIHHIDARGMGGDYQGKKDVIENLMAVCRNCHIKYGDKKQFKDMLRDTHKLFLDASGVNHKL